MRHPMLQHKRCRKSVHFCGYDFILYLHVSPQKSTTLVFCENTLSMAETILNANTLGILGNDFRLYIYMQITYRFPNGPHKYDCISKRVFCPSCVKLKVPSKKTEHEFRHSRQQSVLRYDIGDPHCSKLEQLADGESKKVILKIVTINYTEI